MIEFFLNNRLEVARLTMEHLWLVSISIGLAALVGVPMGILITRRPLFKRPVLGVSDLIQTIPSLALFGLLLPVWWLGENAVRLAVLALTLYALLPIVRNTFEGIKGVDPAVREAARGMGMTDWQILRAVELPLAVPVIVAGIRIATVTTIGVATVAAAIGAGGLGEFIFRGLAMVDNRVILAGALPAALLALLADGALSLVERLLRRHRPA